MNNENDINYSKLIKPNKNQIDEIMIKNSKLLDNIKEVDGCYIAEINLKDKINVNRSISKNKYLKEKNSKHAKKGFGKNDISKNKIIFENEKKEFLSSKIQVLDEFQIYFKNQIDFSKIKLTPILISYNLLIQKIEYFYQYYSDLVFKNRLMMNKFSDIIYESLNSKHSNNRKYIHQTFINIIYSCEKLKTKYQEILIFLNFIKSEDQAYINIYLYFRYYLKLTMNINHNFYIKENNFNPTNIEIDIINCKSIIENAFKIDKTLVIKLINDFKGKYKNKKVLNYYKFLNFITKYFGNNEIIKNIYIIFKKFTENYSVNSNNVFEYKKIKKQSKSKSKSIYNKSKKTSNPVTIKPKSPIPKEIPIFTNSDKSDIVLDKILSKLNYKIERIDFKNSYDFQDGDIINIKRIIKKKFENIIICLYENNFKKYLKICRVNNNNDRFIDLYNKIKINFMAVKTNNKREDIDKLLDNSINMFINFKDFQDMIKFISNLYNKNSNINNIIDN